MAGWHRQNHSHIGLKSVICGSTPPRGGHYSNAAMVTPRLLARTGSYVNTVTTTGRGGSSLFGALSE